MFELRPSSPFRRSDQPAKSPQLEVADLPDVPQGPFIDEGLPVPESYNVDIIRAMLQDPFRVFIYWEVRDESLKALTHYFSRADASAFRTTLKLFEVTGRDEAYFDVPGHGRYWMMVFPDREYEFEIGVRSEKHGYIALVRSNRVRTPRGTVSPVASDDGKYKLSPEEFVDVLEVSGFGAQQTLDLTVAAARADFPRSETAEKDPFEELLARLPAAVRDAILAASRGEPLSSRQIELMPEPLRSALSDLASRGDGRLASVGIVHYLPELFREAFEDYSDLIADHVHPLHLTPRFFAGGTENVMPPSREIHLPTRPSSVVLAPSGRGRS